VLRDTKLSVGILAVGSEMTYVWFPSGIQIMAAFRNANFVDF
jgi:hypothetical protein